MGRASRTWRLALPILVAMSHAAWAQEMDPEVSAFGKRHDAFLLLWGDAGVPLRDIRDLNTADPSEFHEWILLVLGDDAERAWSDLPLRRFVENGGSLFVATDRSAAIPLPDRPGFPHHGRAIDVISVAVEALRAEDQYEGRPACPLVRNFNRESPLFEGVSSIALNHPAILGQPERVASSLAFLPRSVRLPFVRRNEPLPILAGRQEGAGRWLVAADQSFLTNEMILSADNLHFADNVVRWLLAGRSPDRVQVAVMVDGAPLRQWMDERFASGEWNRQPPMMEVLNELLNGLQKEDVFNTLVRDGQQSLGQRGPWPLRQILLVLAASFIIARLVGRVLAARRDEPPAAKDPPSADHWTVIERRPPHDRPMDARQWDVERSGNLAAPLRELAIDFFERRFSANAWRQEPVRITNRSSGWRGYGDRRRLEALRQLAIGEEGARVGKRQFHQWRSILDRWDEMMEKSSTSTSDPER